MPLTNLATRSRQEVHDWIQAFQKAGDSLLTTDLHEFYYSGSAFRYANNDIIYGLDNITAFFEPVFNLLKSMTHTINHFDVVKNRIYLEAGITYVVANDPEEKAISIPAVAIFDIVPDGKEGEGMIERVGIYLDASEIFERIQKFNKF